MAGSRLCRAGSGWPPCMLADGRRPATARGMYLRRPVRIRVFVSSSRWCPPRQACRSPEQRRFASQSPGVAGYSPVVSFFLPRVRDEKNVRKTVPVFGPGKRARGPLSGPCDRFLGSKTGPVFWQKKRARRPVSGGPCPATVSGGRVRRPMSGSLCLWRLVSGGLCPAARVSRPCPAARLLTARVRRFVALVWNPVSRGPCPAACVRQPVSGGPCPVACVRRSVSGGPCPVDSCP